jgi:hypothetical protein
MIGLTRPQLNFFGLQVHRTGIPSVRAPTNQHRDAIRSVQEDDREPQLVLCYRVQGSLPTGV